MKICMEDIRKRLTNLSKQWKITSINESKNKFNTKYFNNQSVDYHINYMKYGVENNCIKPNTLFNIFESVVFKGNKAQLNRGTNIICEWVDKSRNASDSLTYIRQKLGRISGKLTSAVNKVEKSKEKSNGNNISVSSNAPSVDVPTVSAPSIKGAENITPENPADSLEIFTRSVDDNSSMKNKDKDIEESFSKIINFADKTVQIDRILENYNKISSRFNIDKYIQKNCFVNRNNIPRTIVEVCNLLDTYDIEEKKKYSISLESCWYAFNKNNIPVSNQEIVTTITDYALSKAYDSNMCIDILEKSCIVGPENYNGKLKVIQEEEPEDDLDEYDDLYESYLSTDKRKSLDDNDFGLPKKRKYPMPDKKHVLLAIKFFNYVDKEDEKELASNIKKKMKEFNVKPASIGKNNRFANYAFVGNKESAFITSYIEDIKNQPNIIEKFRANSNNEKYKELNNVIHQIFGSSLSNEIKTKYICDLLIYIKDILIPNPSCDLRYIICALKELNSYIYKNTPSVYLLKELLRCIEFISKSLLEKENIEENNLYNELISTLVDIENNLKTYINLLEKDDNNYNSSYNEYSYKEAFVLPDLYNKLNNNRNYFNIDRNMCERVLRKNPSILENTVELCKLHPEVIPMDYIIESLESICSDIDSNKININILDKYAYKNKLNDIKSYKYKEPESLIDETNIYSCLDEVDTLASIIESYFILDSPYTSINIISESSVTNSIKLANEKIKKGLGKLNDKQKKIFKDIDVASNNLSKSIERSFASGNRESVLRGSIFPSASKIVKLALTSGVLFFIHPAIAVINVLGNIALSKKYKAKERQMVIDEIEIELEMCEKYIQLAESKDDMKALKRCLQIKKALTRQRQRIKYRMRINGQKYYSTDDNSFE